MFRLPRPGREEARQQAAAGHPRAGGEAGGVGRHGDRPRQAGGQPTHRPRHDEGSRRQDAAVENSQAGLVAGGRDAAALDRGGCGVSGALGFHQTGAPGAAVRDAKSDRRVHPRALAKGRSPAVARGSARDAHPPGVARPHGAAADAGGSVRVSRRPGTRRLRTSGGPAAGLAALRRENGAAVARLRALRGQQRLPERRIALHVAVARLGHSRLQQQPAVRPIYH